MSGTYIEIPASGGGGGGDITGPTSSTDNALARFDGTTGKIIQNSSAILADSGDLSLGIDGTSVTVDDPTGTVNGGTAGGSTIIGKPGGNATATNNVEGQDVLAGNGGSIVIQGGVGGVATSDNGAFTQNGAGGNVYIYQGTSSAGDPGAVYIGNGSGTVSISGSITVSGSTYFNSPATFTGGVSFSTGLDMSGQTIANCGGLYTEFIYPNGGANPVIVPGATTLQNGSGQITCDWGNQQLTSGSTIIYDWGSQTLNDSSGVASISCTSRQLRNSSGANVAGWNVGGQTFNITTASSSTKGLCILSSASQSANLQEWQNSSGTAIAQTSSAGKIGAQAGTSGVLAKHGGRLTQSTTQATSSGTAETDLHSYTVAANTFSTNGDTINFTLAGQFATSAFTKQLKVKLGGTTIFDSGALGISASTDWVIEGQIIRSGSGTQKCNTRLNTSSGTLSAYSQYAATSITDTASMILKSTGTVGTTGGTDIHEEMTAIDFVPAF